MDNWQQIATSAKHDAIPNDDSLHVAGNDEFEGKQKSMGVTSAGNTSWQQSYYAAAKSDTMGIDPVRQQRLEEDMYVKQNLEYENRLKEHLYLFQDPSKPETTKVHTLKK